MVIKFTLLLIPPVLASFYYSIEREITWLLLSVTALVIMLYALNGLVGRIANKLVRRILGFFLIALLAFFELSRLASFYFQGESFNARFFFHFGWSSITEAGSAYLPILIAVLIYFIVISFLCWIWFGNNSRQTKSFPASVQLFALFFALFILEPDISQSSARQIQAWLNAGKSLTVDRIAWHALELNPDSLAVGIGPAVAGRNLVFIYLESLEDIYTDERIFPGLTPHLNRLKQSGLTFSRMKQTEGTGWTIAGMVASHCGTPLLYSSVSGGNDILQTGFLNQAVCLGDILKQAGYYQVYMGGASTQFAGKGDFLAGHGYDEVLGRAALSDQLDDATYLSGWGLYDDSLFKIAEEKFKLLAQSYQPFNLTLLTLDTHHPDGHASRSCAKYRYYENTMLDAVHCTDFLINRFIKSISQHPAWKNTLVVLFSDHLAMRNVAQRYYPSGYERLLSFVVLNADAMREINIDGTHMDIAPTVLHLMDVQHDRAFLAGKNLMNGGRRELTDMLLSKQRLDAIQYINRHFLTRMDDDPCSGEYLIVIRDNTVNIGNHAITMNLAGHPLAPETLGSSHGLLVVLNDHGKVEHSVTFNLENLNHIVYQYAKVPFLLIARADYLPQFISRELNQVLDDDIAALRKNTQGKFDFLGSSSDPAYLKIENSGCSDRLLKTRRHLEKETEVFGLLDICRAGDSDKNYIDSKTGDIHLTGVAYENVWYHTVLSKIDTDRYSVADLIFQGEIIPDPQSSNCHAYFGNDELIIPFLKSGKQTYAVKMKRIPELDGQFKILEKIIWQ